MKEYRGFVPPCGVYCGGCYRYKREKNRCPGGEGCKARQCKTIFMCTQKREIVFCHECNIFPCSRFKKFAKSWESLGHDLIKNQQEIQHIGKEAWLDIMNTGCEE